MSEKISWSERIVPLSEIIPNERNLRTITRQQYEKLKSSLQETGYHARLTCDRDLALIGGHMRLKAMQDLGFTEVTILVPSRGLTPEERKRIAVQDNIAFGEWDLDILASDFNLDDLTSWGIDENTLKFSLGSPTEGFSDPDAMPAKVETPIAVMGDVWLLDAYFECEDCSKQYPYIEGKGMKQCVCG